MIKNYWELWKLWQNGNNICWTIESFEIWTDHENLKYFREPYKLNK